MSVSKFRTLDEVELRDKRVLLRLDLNVPTENGQVTDATRLERVAPTILEIADKGGKVILLSHFGRPKGPDPKDSLRPVAAKLSEVIGRPVTFVDDCIGQRAEAIVKAMKPGDIVCLENTRFHSGEEKNDPAFAEQIAQLGDIYVNDAFSAAHRAHASTEGLAHKLPAYAGRAMQAELEALSKALENPQRPVVAIVGGAKISTKLDLLGKPVGKSLVERDLIPTAQDILARAKAEKHEIVLPVDVVVARKFEANAPSRVVGIMDVADDEMILDIGPKSIEQVASVLARSKTLVWNGPFGAFEMEPFDIGTVEAAEAAAELTQAGKLVSVAGGGDTVAALNIAHAADRFTYVSTAGGAFLEWMEGKPLPGVDALRVR